jgi:hypothetical protein
MGVDPRPRGTAHRSATRRPSWLLRGRDGNSSTTPSSNGQQHNSNEQQKSDTYYDCDDEDDGATSSSSPLPSLPPSSSRGRRRIIDHDRSTFSISHAAERRLRLSACLFSSGQSNEHPFCEYALLPQYAGFPLVASPRNQQH